jgi:hypothetical protein
MTKPCQRVVRSPVSMAKHSIHFREAHVRPWPSLGFEAASKSAFPHTDAALTMHGRIEVPQCSESDSYTSTATGSTSKRM